MTSELSKEIIQELDLQSELNPLDVIQRIKVYPLNGLSPHAMNQLKYFEAKSHVTMRHFQEAEQIAIECLSLAIPERDYFILVKCNVMQGLCYLHMGIELSIRPCLELAIEFAIQSGDFELLIYASSNYLIYLRTRTQFSSALEEEKRIVDLVKRTPPSFTSMNALMNVAKLYLDLNKLDKTIRFLRQALAYAQVLEIPTYQLTIINNLASGYIRIEDYRKAEEILLNGLRVAQDLSQIQQIAHMLFNLGNLMNQQKRYSESIEYYDKCYAKVTECNFMSPMFLIDLYNNYSMCYWYLNNPEESIKYIDKAIEIATENGFENDKIQMEESKTNIMIGLGEYKAAKTILNNSIKYYKKGKQYTHLLRASRSLAYLYSKLNDYKKSYEICRKVDEITDEYISQILNKQTVDDSGNLSLADLNFDSISSASPLQHKIDHSHGFIGRSKAHQKVLNAALLAAQHNNTNVLIMGESGTGKEVIAQIIHKNSIRRNNPFIPVNIGALSATLLESELFGHTKGAFTGADTQTKGYFLQADKGSIFLDEIAEMPYELQSKLLRVIETRKVSSVGSSKETTFDCRIICATNQDLREKMFEQKFRLDLFHRLNTIEIIIPPLRERREDIEPIIQYYVENYSYELKKPKPFLDRSFIDMMLQYSFPGNVRELKNIIERMFILSKNLHWDDKLVSSINPFNFGIEEKSHLQQSDEEDMILKALIKAKGKQKEAAILLNMSEATLYRRIVKYNLQKHTRKGS